MKRVLQVVPGLVSQTVGTHRPLHNQQPLKHNDTLDQLFSNTAALFQPRYYTTYVIYTPISKFMKFECLENPENFAKLKNE